MRNTSCTRASHEIPDSITGSLSDRAALLSAPLQGRWSCGVRIGWPSCQAARAGDCARSYRAEPLALPGVHVLRPRAARTGRHQSRRRGACLSLSHATDQPLLVNHLASMHHHRSLFNGDISGGMPAVINKMLVASEPGRMQLLPALPKAWPTGTIEGVLCRGQIEVKRLHWSPDFSEPTETDAPGQRRSNRQDSLPAVTRLVC